MSKQHEPKVRDPLAHVAKGVSGYAGSLVMASLGGLFVAYVFNFHGLQTGLDAYFNGLDHRVKSHSGQVVGTFLKVLPFLGFLLAGGILYIIGNSLLFFITNKLKGIFKPKKSKVAEVAEPSVAQALVQASVAAPPVLPAAAAPVMAVAAKPEKSKSKEPAVLIKPVRLNRKETGVTKVAPMTGQPLALR